MAPKCRIVEEMVFLQGPGFFWLPWILEETMTWFSAWWCAGPSHSQHLPGWCPGPTPLSQAPCVPPLQPGGRAAQVLVCESLGFFAKGAHSEYPQSRPYKC